MIVPHSTSTVETLAGRTEQGLALRQFRVGNRVGECPIWSDARLTWIDVRAPAFHALDPASGRLSTWTLPKPVGAHALCADGSILLALRDELALLDTEHGCLRTVVSPEPDRPHNRLNEGRVSPCGAWFVFGSMDDSGAGRPTGQLHAWHPQHGSRVLLDGLHIANGFAWSVDGQTFCFSDSKAGVVYRARWQPQTGTLADIVPWVTADEHAGRPDGAFIDADDNYWSAGVSAGCINVYAPTGARIRKLPLPCQAPSMVCPGPRGSVFVTSLVRPHWAPQDIRPEDGQLFQLLDVLASEPPAPVRLRLT
ncbi:SMP-30/gluconolactonase/LRE family protein [Cupriavidus taiwanensis]|uniref:SMP-30/gluconolactonase/LRE family protein n=1 Tax=Cupriavidus taiwanensis TaxID=164546 RepID=UPI002540604A|nr:SMP-30/gluconolactonase/LRE family protein [Cupriavidus taiwanensis]MDK3021756.1 SMP-30/gluconolactonase/LRE family protein [Cupriavidus taiwanensis]